MTPMRYVAIDCETTSRDEETGQILEIGLVAETDWVQPVEELPSLRLLLWHPFIKGEPFALAMNVGLLRELADDEKAPVSTAVTPGQAVNRIKAFIETQFGADAKVVLGGTNAAGFDVQFLRRLPGWKQQIRHRAGVLCTGTMWFDPATDDRLPDTAECLRRAGVTNPKPHSALDDARAVVAMVRARYAVKEGRVAA